MVRLMKALLGLLGWLIGMAPALAVTVPVNLCADQVVYPYPDGRVLGHLPYTDAQAFDLVIAAPGFSLSQPCYIQRAAAADLERLLRAADQVPEIAGTLRGVSCFRSTDRQHQVFCSRIGPGRASATAAERARSVAPPGYSEHSTGYAIDFGIRPTNGCTDVDSCIAWMPAGRWLMLHAREFGFELSFPGNNLQGVTWEPWHWRWVGTSISAPGAVAARTVFARARANYRANPGLFDPQDHWLPVLKPPVAAPAPAAKPAAPWPPVYVQPLPPRGAVKP